MKTDRLYLDTEFNGHGGQLITMAIAAPDGVHWYGCWPLPQRIDAWVKENVIPRIDYASWPTRSSEPILRASLYEYLREREGAILYADWPADFMYLLQQMCGPRYDVAFVVDIRMRLLRVTDPKSSVPHNALHDAIGLLSWHEGTLLEG